MKKGWAQAEENHWTKAAEPSVDRNSKESLARWILWNDSNAFDTDDPKEVAQTFSIQDLQHIYDDMKKD